MSFKCPKCGAPLAERYEKCPKCGAKFSWGNKEKKEDVPAAPVEPAPAPAPAPVPAPAPAPEVAAKEDFEKADKALNAKLLTIMISVAEFAVAALIIVNLVLAALRYYDPESYYHYYVNLLPLLLLVGVVSVAVLILMGILNLKRIKAVKVLPIKAHPYKTEADKLHKRLRIIAVVLYFILLAGTGFGLFMLEKLYVHFNFMIVGAPILLCLLERACMSLIEYHWQRDYLRIQQVQALEELKNK